MKPWLSLGMLLLTVACGEGGGGDSPAPGQDAGPPPEQDAETPRDPNGVRCTDAKKLGEFRIAPSKGYANLSGQVFSHVVPSVEYTVVGMESGCTLIKKRNPFCDPPCSGGDACTPSGTCETPAMSLDLGTVSVSGLSMPVSMEPTQPGNTYFDTNVPEDGVPIGAAIHLTSENNSFAPLNLYGTGLTPLEVTTERVEVKRDTDVELAWKVPTEGKGQVRITLNVDQHGNSPVSLSCDVPDDGAHTIPKSLINQLLDSGVSGFPIAFVSRDSVDSMENAKGCVEFLVTYKVQRSVDVAGHTPCMTNAQCPEGQHCNMPIQTCQPD